MFGWAGEMSKKYSGLLYFQPTSVNFLKEIKLYQINYLGSHMLSVKMALPI